MANNTQQSWTMKRVMRVVYYGKKLKRALTSIDPTPVARSPSCVDRDKQKTHQLARRHRITCTSELVEAINSPRTGSKDRAVLFQWLVSYHKAFANASENLPPETVREYTELVKIKIRRRRYRNFQKEILKNLTKIFSPNEEDNEKVNEYAEILYHALTNMNQDFLKEAAQELYSLAHKLIQCIPADLEASERDFRTRSYIFYALHQTLDLLYDACQFEDTSLDRFHNGMIIRQKCKAMGTSRGYHCWYYMKIVEQDIGRLNRMKFNKEETDWCAILGHTICGVLHWYHTIRQGLDFDVDVEAFQKGRSEIEQAAEHFEIKEEKWYGLLQELAEKCRAGIHQNMRIQDFQNAYKAALERQKECRLSFDKKAFLFGQIAILRSFARNACSEEIRVDAVDKLINLSKEDRMRDPDILNAFLETFHLVCSQEQHREKVAAALKEGFQSMPEGSSQRQQFRRWLNNKTIEEKLCKHEESSEDIGNELFEETRKEAGHLLTVSEMDGFVCYLKSRYKEKGFSEVSFSADRYSPKQVKDMKFAKGNERAMGSDSTDSSGEHIAKESLHLGDLFSDDAQTSVSNPRPCKRVLLIGNPGIGKTCFAKSVACQWAHDDLETDFEVIYFIPVGALNDERKFNPSEYQGGTSLERVIAKLWFDRSGSHENPATIQIQHDLCSPKTLLIFDGLDERNALANNLLTSAYCRDCKLLLTSRPCNLQDVQHHVDRTVRCSGLTDSQLLELIHSEIEEEGPEMVKLLYPHPALWEVAHVPMISHILCITWKDSRSFPTKTEMTKSLWSLYEQMTTRMWNKLAESRKRLGNENRHNAFDCMGEIAFAALKDGQNLIRKRDVDRASRSVDESSLRDCGFLVQKMDSKDCHFLHPVFQEFFTGRYLVKALKDHLQQMSKPPKRRDVSYKVVEEFLTRGKYLKTQKNAIAFMTEGFLQDKEFDDFHRLVESMDPKAAAGISEEQRLFAKLHLLNAALSFPDPSSIDDAKENDIVQDLMQSLRELIANHLSDANRAEKLVHQLGQIPNVLSAFPDLVTAITDMIEQDASPLNASHQHLIQIIARVPGHEEWVVKIFDKQASHQDDDARAHALENIARVLIVSSGKVTEDLMKILEENRESESAEHLKTIKGTDPSDMQSQLQLLEYERQIFIGDVLSEARE